MLLAAQLLTDINQQVASGEPQEFVKSGSYVFFRAKHPLYGEELWRTDGTAEGTALVKDISPGSRSGTPWSLIDVNGTLYFWANTAQTGIELWKSDGTADGTVIVKDLLPGPGSSSPQSFFTDGTSLYFNAGTPELGRELYRTDGTSGGTVLVKDFNPGAGDSAAAGVSFNGHMLLSVNDGTRRLWLTDGTPDGTVPVKDIEAERLTKVGSSVFFVSGFWLYKTDGTADGTVLVRDKVGTSSLGPRKLFEFKGKLYFTRAGASEASEIWTSDGTTEGTTLVFDSDGGIDRDSVSDLMPFGDHLYFMLRNPGGDELWRTDGSGAGTELVYAGADFSGVIFPSSPNEYAVTPARLFFTGTRLADNTTLLFVTDGTATGTKALSPSNHDISVLSGKAIFAGVDASHGREVWHSEGTSAGTAMLRDVNPSTRSAAPGPLTVFGEKMYFSATDGLHSWRLWGTDGNTAPALVMNLTADPNAFFPEHLTLFDDALIFQGIGWQSATTGLWRTDGTAAGTTLLAQYATSLFSPVPQSFVQSGLNLYFTTFSSGSAMDLWTTAGTPQTTRRIITLNTNGQLDKLSPLVPLGGKLYFVASHNDLNRELWVSDGTAAGTTRLLEIRAGAAGSYPQNLFAFNGAIYFSADDGVRGRELYKTDGTAAGTVLVKDIHAGGSSDPGKFAIYNNQLYFTAADGDGGRELWRTDGTSNGTFRVKDIASGAAGSSPLNLYAAGPWLYFSADDGVHGRELWRSDGSEAGTMLVKDINPGAESGLMSEAHLRAFGGVLMLAANDGVHGVELWKSDGTAGGTELFQEIMPGIDGSEPQNFVVLNDRLYFEATDAAVGKEIWTLRDEFAPQLIDAPFALGSQVQVTFSENVGASVGAGDLLVESTGEPGGSPGVFIPADVVYDPASNTARFTFDQPLPDGNYRATLNGIVDAAGNPIAATPVAFFMLKGDIDRDRAVSFVDLLTTAANFGKTPVAPWQGDVDGDGTVGFVDLLAVAANFGRALSPPAAPLLAASSTETVSRSILKTPFATKPMKLAPAKRVLKRAGK